MAAPPSRKRKRPAAEGSRGRRLPRLLRRASRPATAGATAPSSSGRGKGETSPRGGVAPPPATSSDTAAAGERPPIDPRIRARRIEVARSTGRRRLRRLTAVVALVAVAAAAWGVAGSPLLDVDRIEVVGGARTGADRVRRASGIEPGDALATLDLDRVEAAVAALPWVESVAARRDWPGSVRLAVEERVAVAAVAVDAPPPESAGDEVDGEGATDGDGPDEADESEARSPSGWMLLSADGHQLERVDELPPEAGIVVIEGVRPAGEPGSVLTEAVGALEAIAVVPDPFRLRLLRIEVADDGDLTAVVRLPDGAGEIPALLGPPVELPEKMVALATVAEQAELAGAEAINVRVPASPALTREAAPE